MKVAARSFRNAQDSIEYCHTLGVDTLIMECSHIPGLDQKGYLEPDAISETMEILENGGLSCSVLVGRPIPVIGRDPQENEELHNRIRTIQAMGEAGVPTMLLFMLERVEEDAQIGTHFGNFSLITTGMLWRRLPRRRSILQCTASFRR